MITQNSQETFIQFCFVYPIIIIIIIMIYLHQEMHIKATNISMLSADNKGQLRAPSLTTITQVKTTLRLYAVWR